MRRGGRASAPILGVLALCLLVVGCDAAEKSRDVRHLILVSVDTFRGDHLLGMRGGVELTPSLEELARESLIFRHAESVSNMTSPGVTGILTGLLPNRSGVRVNEHMLPSGVPTLATALSRAGFRTAAFVGNPVLAPGNGFENGFATYELIGHERPRRKVLAEAITDRVSAWLDQQPLAADERLLLWVHYMDPHGPYEPPEDVLSEFDEATFDAPTDIPLAPRGDQSGYGSIPFYQQYGQETPSQDGRYYERRYAAAVRYVDSEIGRLVAILGAAGILDQAVFVLTADHGEALGGDHGFFFSHGNGVTEDQTHVPLLLRVPGTAGGVVEGRTVSTADVAPTALELLGVGAPIELDGQSLLRDPARPAVSQTHVGMSAVDWPWKLSSLRDGRLSLFNLETDSAEEVDLAEGHPEILGRLRALLRAKRGEPALAPSQKREILTKEKREALRDLGYL